MENISTMNNKIKQLLVSAACILVAASGLQAQTTYKAGGSKSDNMKLSGTSTFHNWNMSAQSFSSQGQFGFAAGSKTALAEIKALSFSLPVEDLKGSEKGLDKNAYEALQSDKYKAITYKLTLAQVMPAKGGKYEVRTKGALTVAGVTKEVVMDVNCTVNADATITCTGSYKMKMTDYQVKPPKFMMGAMTTGDEITLDFTLVYKP